MARRMPSSGAPGTLREGLLRCAITRPVIGITFRCGILGQKCITDFLESSANGLLIKDNLLVFIRFR